MCKLSVIASRHVVAAIPAYSAHSPQARQGQKKYSPFPRTGLRDLGRGPGHSAACITCKLGTESLHGRRSKGTRIRGRAVERRLQQRESIASCSTLHEGCVLSHPALRKGVVVGRDRIQAYVQRGTEAGYRIDAIKILTMDCSGDLAYTVGRYESTNAGQKALGVNVVVLRKTGGTWRIVAHESAVPEPAAVERLDGR
jgi:ketosteroid isomerase-like protein